MNSDSLARKTVATVCPYCGVGCGMLLTVEENRIVKVEGDRKHPANFGKLCTKGVTCALTVQTDDRLAFAQLRSSRAEPLQRVAMETAIEATATRLQQIIATHGPDAVSIYLSGQLSTEAQYLANKLCKGFFKTNNIDSNSRLCMASAASGYKLSLGADGPPGSYRDFELADCFFVIGSNMADCHPILFTRLLAARNNRGAKLIVVDPRRTATAEKADLYLPIRPGTDLALLNGLLHLFVEAGHIDPAFIERNTEGWPAMLDFLLEYSPAHVAEITGLRAEDIRLAAKWMGEAPELMSLWTMGLNQSTHGTWSTNAICNLHLATGKICRPGSGPFSLTGQPNAMGGREVGYLSAGLPGQRTVTRDADRAFVENLWGLAPGTIRAQPGPDAVELFKKVRAGGIKAVWIICTNPVASMPSRAGVIEALQAAELVIVQDVYHPTETGNFADILLPGALWVEAEGVMVNSERNVTLMGKAVDPPGEACADWDIIARVARAMGYVEAFNFHSAAEVFDEIRATANPLTGYDLRGMSYPKLRREAMQWPCAPDAETGEPIRYRTSPCATPENATPTLVFATETGRGRFFPRPHLPAAELPDLEFPFILNTGRVANQWHTMTKTGKVPKLNYLNPGPFIEIHPEDALLLALSEGDFAEVRSRRGRAIFPARVTDAIRPGCCFAPFHWNDLFGENLTINAATSEATDPISKQPELKFCAVQVTKVAIQPERTREEPGEVSALSEDAAYQQGLAAGQQFSAFKSLPLSGQIASPRQRGFADSLTAPVVPAAH